jgi:hypothetical protein
MRDMDNWLEVFRDPRIAGPHALAEFLLDDLTGYHGHGLTRVTDAASVVALIEALTVFAKTEHKK